MRDRNHPSVFVWSIGNEIGPGGEGLTPDRVAMMRNVVRKYDATRPVGIASHIPDLGRGPIFDALDFVGWNYCRHYSPVSRASSGQADHLQRIGRGGQHARVLRAAAAHLEDRLFPRAPGHVVRLQHGPLGRHPRPRIRLDEAGSLRRGRVCLVGHRLPGRADAVRQRCEKLLFRHRRSLRHSQGSLLALPQPVAARRGHGPHLAALELARSGRTAGAGLRLHQRRFGRVVLERSLARAPHQGRGSPTDRRILRPAPDLRPARRDPTPRPTSPPTETTFSGGSPAVPTHSSGCSWTWASRAP